MKLENNNVPEGMKKNMRNHFDKLMKDKLIEDAEDREDKRRAHKERVRNATREFLRRNYK